MNTGEKIKAARILRGMTMKELGTEMDYSYKNADIRIAQYESGKRRVKTEVIEKLAEILNVSPKALTGPTGYEEEDVMRILFELEENGYDIDIHKKGDHIVVEIAADHLDECLKEWKKVRTRVKSGRMSEQGYVEWKLCWPDNLAGAGQRSRSLK